MASKLEEYLEKLGLIQEPPRIRTIIASNGPVRLKFPWVSIGSHVGSLYAFAHERAWTDIEDAAKIVVPFRDGSDNFHCSISGVICLEGYAFDAFIQGAITPSEAFWMTASENDHNRSGHSRD